MRAIELQRFGGSGLSLVERPVPRPGPGEILVRVLAGSLNYRDVEIAHGRYGMPVTLPIVPLSDGVGEVVALGPNTTHYSIGDKVIPLFFPLWLDGPFQSEYFRHQLGSSVRGVLQEFITVPEVSVVRAPRHLGNEAASLPIAALTAWNALRDAGVSPGQIVVIIGTGGVSLFALQFTRALGAEAIVVSTSDTKLQHARALGPRAVINSTTVPNWGESVLALTGGRGADVIIEVGGAKTLPQSSIALRVGGHIAMVGYLSGPEVTLDLRSLFIGKRAHLQGHTVGSRTSFEEMNRAMETHQLVPIIDSTFSLERARAAYERAQSGEAFGKVLITL